MSGFGYNLPSEPPPRHFRNGPNSGPFGHDVRIPPDSFRCTLICGRLPVGKGILDGNACWSVLPSVRPLGAALINGRWP